MGRPRTFGRLTDEQRGLAESGLRLACKAAHRVADRLGADREAALDAAMYALVRAAALYSPSRGAGWSTYCTVSVTWEVRRALTGRAAGEMPNAPEEALEALPDRAGGPAARGEADALLRLAGPEAAEAVRLYVVRGLSMRESAAALGLPPRAVRSLVRDGLAEIRRGLEGAADGTSAQAA